LGSSFSFTEVYVLSSIQFSLRNLILATAFFAVCIELVGRVTQNGSIVFSHQNNLFVEKVLGDYGIRSYELYSSSNSTRVYFPKPFTLTTVDDAIVKDALKRGYSIKIEYNAIIPHFSSQRIVNAGSDLFSNR